VTVVRPAWGKSLDGVSLRAVPILGRVVDPVEKKSSDAVWKHSGDSRAQCCPVRETCMPSVSSKSDDGLSRSERSNEP
jgi:hypothetical protein